MKDNVTQLTQLYLQVQKGELNLKMQRQHQREKDHKEAQHTTVNTASHQNLST